MIGAFIMRPSLLKEIIRDQGLDQFVCQTIKELIIDKIKCYPQEWSVESDDSLCFFGLLYVLGSGALK